MKQLFEIDLNRKIAAIKLDRLEDYIEMVRPDDDKKEDCTDVKIDIDNI